MEEGVGGDREIDRERERERDVDLEMEADADAETMVEGEVGDEWWVTCSATCGYDSATGRTPGVSGAEGGAVR